MIVSSLGSFELSLRRHISRKPTEQPYWNLILEVFITSMCELKIGLDDYIVYISVDDVIDKLSNIYCYQTRSNLVTSYCYQMWRHLIILLSKVIFHIVIKQEWFFLKIGRSSWKRLMPDDQRAILSELVWVWRYSVWRCSSVWRYSKSPSPEKSCWIIYCLKNKTNCYRNLDNLWRQSIL